MSTETLPRPDPAGRSPARREPSARAFHVLQWCFAAFCVLATVLLFPAGPVEAHELRVAAVVVYPLALVFALACALRPVDEGLRALVTRVHYGLLLVQFVLAFGGLLPWVGFLLSVLVLIQARHQVGRLSSRWRRLWLAVHVGVSVGWLGASLVMVAMSLVGLLSVDPGLRHQLYVTMHLITLTVVIPSVVLAIVSGLVLSFGTKWALVHHRWVLAKFGIALAIPIFATLVESGWLNDLVELTRDPGHDHGGLATALTLSMIAYFVLLWTATWLSIAKPGGRTRWGERHASRQGAHRAAARGS